MVLVATCYLSVKGKIDSIETTAILGALAVGQAVPSLFRRKEP